MTTDITARGRRVIADAAGLHMQRCPNDHGFNACPLINAVLDEYESLIRAEADDLVAALKAAADALWNYGANARAREVEAALAKYTGETAR